MTTALSVRDATKIFGGQTALDHVSIDVQPGEVRALVGQNGCGKSTLIKILAGFHQPEPGTSVTVGGQELDFSNATASEAVGLRFVHQDLGLVANLDAVDNMAIGQGYITGATKTALINFSTRCANSITVARTLTLTGTANAAAYRIG
jgi:ribose transport system ATP-binding protein